MKKLAKYLIYFLPFAVLATYNGLFSKTQLICFSMFFIFMIGSVITDVLSTWGK